MANYTATPSGWDNTDYSYYGISSSYPLSNMVGEDTTGTKYAGLNLTRNSNAETYLYITFDLSSVPNNTRITSVSASIKLYGSTTLTSRTTDRTVQAYCGATEKGSATDFSLSGSSQIITIDNCGEWTREELDNARIKVYAKRNSSNTTSNTYLYIQGAEFTVEYETATKRTLTITTNGYNVQPSGDIEVYEGQQVEILVSEQTMPQATLDETDITNDFTKSNTNETYTGSPSQSSYTGLSSGSNYVSNAIGKTAENPYTGTNNWYGSSSASVDSQYAQYTFDVSSIPSNATNISVSCKVAGKAESSTYSHQSGGRYSVWGLCSNGVSKGSQINATSTSISVLEFTNTGDWTRSELNNLQLRHYVGYYGGSTNGATLTITYSIPGSGSTYTYVFTMGNHDSVLFFGSSGEVFYRKTNGVWKKYTLYQKVNGQWTKINFTNAYPNLNNEDITTFIKEAIEV